MKRTGPMLLIVIGVLALAPVTLMLGLANDSLGLIWVSIMASIVGFPLAAVVIIVILLRNRKPPSTGDLRQ